MCVKTLQLVNFHNFHLKLELWALIKTCLAMSEVIGAHESVISCSMNLCSRLSFEPNGHWLQHCTQKKKKPTFMTYKIHKYNRLNKKDFKIMYAIKSNNYIFFTIKMHDIKEKTFLTVY